MWSMVKLGVASYSYNRYLADGKMTIEDFIDEAFGLDVDGVELNQLYFKPEIDRIKGIKKALLDYGLDLSCVTVDNNFCKPDPNERRREVEFVKNWIDATVKLSSPIMRINAGWPPKGISEDEAFEVSVKCIKEAVDYAERYGLMIVVENHGGITSTAEQVLRLIKTVDSDWFRVNLDLGNFRENIYESIEAVMPYTFHIHAKIYELALEWYGLSCYWVEKKLDYRRIMEIITRYGYNGYLSLEYEGKDDPLIAVPRALDFLDNIIP